MAGPSDTATPARILGCIDLVTQVTGTFSGTTVVLQGSLDDVTYFTLNDTSGTPVVLSFTAAGIKRAQERVLYVKPSLSAGTGSALKIVVLCQTSYP